LPSVGIVGKTYYLSGVIQFCAKTQLFRTIRKLKTNHGYRWIVFDKQATIIRGNVPREFEDPDWVISTVRFDLFVNKTTIKDRGNIDGTNS
jgi:hypothetical protein